MPPDDDMPTAAQTAYNDPNRPLIERLVIELRWSDQLENVSEFRDKLWSALLSANEEELSNASRAYPDEVHAIRLYRTTWLHTKLRDEGLL